MDKHDYSAQPPGAGPASDVPLPGHAQALVQAWSHLSGRLVPLIGDNGFSALFGRTLRMVAPDHPCLSIAPSRKTSVTLLGGLEADLAAVEEGIAVDAHAALMRTFTRQLGALIGPALTTRLLSESTAGDEQQQNQQEHK
jgi:hypothetical protein